MIRIINDEDIGKIKHAKPRETIVAYRSTEKGGVSHLYNKKESGRIGPTLITRVGRKLEVLEANTDPYELCAAGVNVGSARWIYDNCYDDDRIFEVRFHKADMAALPMQDGMFKGKFRLFRCHVHSRISYTALRDLVYND